MTVRVGTSGYNYDEWKGSFYPADLPASRMLAFYAERFDTVEINATFYRMPTPKTLAGWAAGTPAHFVFALKAPQRITHLAHRLVDAAQTLGPKLGPVLFQLPPNFARDVGRLADLLALLPPGLRCAMEFRNDSWFADEVYERLRGRNVALCIADTEKGTTPVVATADFGYLRLRDEGYDDDELGRFIDTIRAQPWQSAWVYFKHEESGTGPAFARRLRHALQS